MVAAGRMELFAAVGNPQEPLYSDATIYATKRPLWAAFGF
jgi:hypothetical protein